MILFANSVNPLQGFLEFFFGGEKRDAHVAVAIAAEDETGREKHVRLVQHALRKLLGIVHTFGNTPPKEHAHLRRVETASEHAHYLLVFVAAAAVGGYVGLVVPLRGVGVVGFCGGELQTSECTRVYIALYLQNPRYELGV